MHRYELARRSDGDWGVFCPQCSHAAQDYVYPCAAGLWPLDPPPPVLSALVPLESPAVPEHEIASPAGELTP